MTFFVILAFEATQGWPVETAWKYEKLEVKDNSWVRTSNTNDQTVY